MTFVSSEIKRLSTTPWRRSARSGKLPCQIPLAKFPSAFWEWKLQSSKIQTEREVWYVFQASYIKDLISKAGEEVKKKKVPITRDQSAQLGEKDEKVEVEDVRQSQKQVGELLSAMDRDESTSRPDVHSF